MLKYMIYLMAFFSGIFRVDKDHSGAISMDELQQALSNGK